MDDYKAYKTWKKKELIAALVGVEEKLSAASWWKSEAERLKEARDADAALIGELRRDNERLVLTPEHKANVEEAYNRGFQAARRNLRAWGVSAIANLESKLTTGDERSPDTTFQHEIFRTLS